MIRHYHFEAGSSVVIRQVPFRYRGLAPRGERHHRFEDAAGCILYLSDLRVRDLAHRGDLRPLQSSVSNQQEVQES